MKGLAATIPAQLEEESDHQRMLRQAREAAAGATSADGQEIEGTGKENGEREDGKAGEGKNKNGDESGSEDEEEDGPSN